jgi:heme exporter protein D
MNWLSLADFIDMGGYGLYVWGSFGMCAAVVAAEMLVLRFRRQALRQELQDQRALTQEFEEVVR